MPVGRCGPHVNGPSASSPLVALLTRPLPSERIHYAARIGARVGDISRQRSGIPASLTRIPLPLPRRLHPPATWAERCYQLIRNPAPAEYMNA